MDDIVKNLKFNFATPEDVNFIVDCIIEAEKSGTNTINTCNIFSLSEKEYRNLLKKLLLDDVPDYDFHLSGYLIAKLDGIPVSAQGAWLEGKNGTSSSTIKTAMLMEYLPKEKFQLPIETIKFIKGLSIQREDQSIQLEHAYTVPELRRRGFHTQTNLEVMKRILKKNPSAKKIQTILFKENYKSYNEVKKLGFTEVTEKSVHNPDILKIFSYDTRLQMEITLNKFEKSYENYRVF